MVFQRTRGAAGEESQNENSEDSETYLWDFRWRFLSSQASKSKQRHCNKG
jgi:hypothetical protein